MIFFGAIEEDQLCEKRAEFASYLKKRALIDSIIYFLSWPALHLFPSPFQRTIGMLANPRLISKPEVINIKFLLVKLMLIQPQRS